MYGTRMQGPTCGCPCVASRSHHGMGIEPGIRCLRSLGRMYLRRCSSSCLGLRWTSLGRLRLRCLQFLRMRRRRRLLLVRSGSRLRLQLLLLLLLPLLLGRLVALFLFLPGVGVVHPQFRSDVRVVGVAVLDQVLPMRVLSVHQRWINISYMCWPRGLVVSKPDKGRRGHPRPPAVLGRG